MHWLQLFITHTHTRSYKITKEKLRYFDIMGANLSLEKTESRVKTMSAKAKQHNDSIRK